MQQYGKQFSALESPTTALLLATTVSASAANEDIVHDAEYYVLDAQHGDVWAAEDKGLDARLAALRERFGAPPNIIHIMMDDHAVGEVGIPALQAVRGYTTPNINQFAADGMNFMRMYTEVACTQSRSAAMTGRMPTRNGMYNVGFPYEYGGLAAEEITMGEILGGAGYATAFYVSYWPSLSAFVPYPEKKTVSDGMLQEGRARLDSFIGTLMERLTELGTAENTLVIFMGDNGPMTHNGPAGMV